MRAIPGIVQCCGQIQPADGTQPTADELQLQADIQVGCHRSSSLHSVLQQILLLCLDSSVIVFAICNEMVGDKATLR